MLDTYIKWFESHERLLIVALVMGLGVYGFNHYVDKSAENAANRSAISAQIAENQKEQDAKNAAYVAQLQVAFNAQQAQRDQEIANLVAAIAQRDAATATHVKQVQQVTTAPEAVQAVVSAYPALPAPLTVTNDGADVPTEDLKVFAVTKIEDDAAAADLKDTQAELKDATAGLVQSTSLIAGQKTQIDGLNLAITKNDKACSDAKDQLKADARKSKWHTFWWGYGAGFVSREAIRVFTGH